MTRCPRAAARACAALSAAVLLAACGDAREPPAAVPRIAELLGGSDTLHARAVEPRTFEFPRDHGEHPEFRTEWWYFTGNLTARDGRELGYQLTFFRTALLDSAAFTAGLVEPASEWRTRHAWMAHFAVTDARAQRFSAHERFARGGAGLAGVRTEPLHLFVGSWTAAADTGAFPLRLVAEADEIAIDLVLAPLKPVVLQGERGLSRKAAEPGNASYYYSLTRLATSGSVRIGSGSHDVQGWSWLDREWSTSVLGEGVVGWDWLSLQLSDSTELMLYRLRRADGAIDPYNAGSYVAVDGSSRTIAASAFSMTPVQEWRSARGAAYPVQWRIEVPSLQLRLDVQAAVDDQELDLYVRYWEGMVRATGTRAGRAVTGRGYLEMTGYADAAGVRGQ